MTARKRSGCGTGVAIGLVLAGLGAAAHAAWCAPARLARLKTKAADLTELRAIEADARAEAARADLWRAGGWPPPLTVLLRSAAAEAGEADVRPAGEETTSDGWRLRRQDVVWTDVRLSAVGRLIGEAEAQRPPWRLVGCRLEAGPRPGFGAVTLTLAAAAPAEETAAP